MLLLKVFVVIFHERKQRVVSHLITLRVSIRPLRDIEVLTASRPPA
jgi:hypothetical protein